MNCDKCGRFWEECVCDKNAETVGSDSGDLLSSGGKEALSTWFSLSYASWLTIPRVLMEDMPEEWQGKMAELLFEYDNAHPNMPNIDTRVQAVVGGKLTKMPDQILNYRRPDRNYINAIKGR